MELKKLLTLTLMSTQPKLGAGERSQENEGGRHDIDITYWVSVSLKIWVVALLHSTPKESKGSFYVTFDYTW